MPPAQTRYPAPLSQDPVWRRGREPPQNPLSQDWAAPACWRRKTAEDRQLATPSCLRRRLHPEQRCQRYPSLLLPLLVRVDLAVDAIRSYVPYL